MTCVQQAHRLPLGMFFRSVSEVLRNAIKHGHRGIRKVRISQRKRSELAKGKGRERSELAKRKRLSKVRISQRKRSELANKKVRIDQWSGSELTRAKKMRSEMTKAELAKVQIDHIPW